MKQKNKMTEAIAATIASAIVLIFFAFVLTIVPVWQLINDSTGMPGFSSVHFAALLLAAFIFYLIVKLLKPYILRGMYKYSHELGINIDGVSNDLRDMIKDDLSLTKSKKKKNTNAED